MISSKMILITALFIAQNAFAESGEKKVFTVEKSYNPENIMVVSALTDDNCKFVKKDSEYINFYWMMERTTRKKVNSAIIDGIKKKIQFDGMNDEQNAFQIVLNDLKEVKHDLGDSPKVEVSSEIENGECQTKAVLKLGKTGDYRKLNLKKTYCEVTTFLGVPTGCAALELIGTDADTGEALKVTFKKK